MDIRHDQLTKPSELTSVGLSRGSPAARFNNARGLRLRVETGAVWVTCEGCDSDTVVRTGETYTIEHDGATVVSSLGRRFALLTVESPAPKPSIIERLGDHWCRLYVALVLAPRIHL